MNPLNPSWLRAVRVSAFCIFLGIFVAAIRMWVSLLLHYDAEDSSSSRLLWAFVPSLLWFPYFWVSWRLRDIRDAERVKKALAQAVSWGLFGAFCFSTGAAAEWTGKDWLMAVLVSILAFLQFVLFVSAIKTYYSMERKRRDLLILGTRFGVIALATVLLAIIIPSSSFLAMEHMEVSAAESLRTITTAQNAYARIHPAKGFAASLEELGPAPGAALIDQDLANGQRYNYTLTLSPPVADSSGHITQYTLIARPHPYGTRGRRSFFTDESGVIHYTAADRPATPNDRVLP